MQNRTSVSRVGHARGRIQITPFGDGDVEALIFMVRLADELDAAIAEAVKGLRGCGYSWTEISSRLGITRQAGQQRWGTSSR
jgi:hypothetical protein